MKREVALANVTVNFQIRDSRGRENAAITKDEYQRRNFEDPCRARPL